jgi:hypothetical protein
LVLLAPEKANVRSEERHGRMKNEIFVKLKRRDLFTAKFVVFERPDASITITLGNENLYALHA